MVILIYLPILIKYHFINSMTNQLTLTISAVLLFGYSYMKIFIEFVKFKCDNWKSKMDIYKDLVNRDTKFKNDFEKYTNTLLEK